MEIRKRVERLAAISVLPVLVVAAVDSVAVIATEETCAGKPEGAECWKPLSDQPDCHVWDDYLVTAQTVTWSGGCVNGQARGQGTLTWSRGDGGSTTQTGRLQDGQRQGHWDLREADGGVGEGPYVDGKQHGHWVLREADGNVAEGPYVDDKQHGHWVVRIANGNVLEGPFVEDKRHGRWITRSHEGSESWSIDERGELKERSN